MLTILVATLIILILVAIIFILMLIDLTKNNLTPKIKTPVQYYGRIERLLKLTPGDKFVDLGCGNGELIHYLAARNPDVHFVGIDNGIIAFLRASLKNRGLANVRIKKASFRQAGKLEANKYYLYLLPEDIKQIDHKIPKNSLVVSMEYQLPGQKYDQGIKLEPSTKLTKNIYLYKL